MISAGMIAGFERYQQTHMKEFAHFFGPTKFKEDASATVEIHGYKDAPRPSRV